MKAYVTVTGALFALVLLVHAWRAVAEGFGPLAEPSFVVSSISCAALCVWAWRLRAGLAGT